jgi:hypothetical protein
MGEWSSRTLDTSLLGAFGDGFAGEIVLPDDPGYDAARVVWNGTADRRPALVVRSVYGDAKLDRLVALKRTRDPDNVFRLNQNIRPEGRPETRATRPRPLDTDVGPSG